MGLSQPERWPSGRRRAPAKGVYLNRYRGFESLPLRQTAGKLLSIWISWLRQRRSRDNARRAAQKGRRAERRVILPSPPICAKAARCRCANIRAPCAPVAQLDRAPGYEPGGREFESLRAHHYFLRLRTLHGPPTSARKFELPADK